jgi:hypothetical protein
MADDEGTEEATTTEDETSEDVQDVAKLREALRKERQARKEAAKRAKDGEAALAQLQHEKIVAAATKQAREDAISEVMRERVADKIEVAAAGKFHDVEDAVLRLGRDADEFVKDGKPDAEAIRKAVDKLLDDKPHLAIQTNGQQRKPSFDQGNRGGNDKQSGKDKGLAELQRRFPQQYAQQ